MASRRLNKRRTAGTLCCVSVTLLLSLGLSALLLVQTRVDLAPDQPSAPPTFLSRICWVLVIAGIIGTALASCGNRTGWLGLFGLQPVWIAYAICTDQHGLILGCAAYGVAQLNGFLRSPVERGSGVSTRPSGSLLAPPGGRRHAKRLLEGARERSLGLVANLFCDLDHGRTRIAKAVCRHLHTPVGQVLHRRHTNYAREPFGQGRARQAGLPPQRINCPVVFNPCMKLRQRARDIRIPKPGKPAGLFRRQRFRVAPHRIDEQQLRQLCQHRTGPGTASSDLLGRVLERRANPLSRATLGNGESERRGKRSDHWIPFHVLATQETTDHAGAGTITAKVNRRKATPLGWPADHVTSLRRCQAQVAAQKVVVVAWQKDDFPRCEFERRITRNLHTEVPLNDEVVQDDVRRGSQEWRTCVRRDTRGQTPGFAKLGVQKHPTRQAGYAQDIRERVDCCLLGSSGAPVNSSGGLIIAPPGQR